MAEWRREMKGYANGIAENFKANLKQIAETFADHEKIDSVSTKHLDEAFSALSRLGLHSKRWWQRSDTWTAFGALLVGVSFSAPDIVSLVCSLFGYKKPTSDTWSFILFVILLICGTCLYFWARHHGSLPKKRGAV